MRPQLCGEESPIHSVIPGSCDRNIYIYFFLLLLHLVSPLTLLSSPPPTFFVIFFLFFTVFVLVFSLFPCLFLLHWIFILFLLLVFTYALDRWFPYNQVDSGRLPRKLSHYSRQVGKTKTVWFASPQTRF